jgi:F-type H+-transporting ATPase subunit epsilon
MSAPPTGGAASLQLRVLLPTEVLVDESVSKVNAEAENGAFCLLPRHVDFVAALVPGVLSFRDMAGSEVFLAIDRGVLVKCGREVSVSTVNGARGGDLRDLRRLIEKRFVVLDERERRARAALARLEAGTLRGFRALQEHARG